MIHYNVRCEGGHEFDGWFRDSAGFDQQVARGLISCPACGSTEVGRALMAPSVTRSGTRVPEPVASVPPVPPAVLPPVPTGLPDQVRAVLSRMRADIERTCTYVGPNFAEQARRMHAGDIEHKPIYGETTDEQAESLADDGIEVSRIPWIPRADS